MNYFSSNAVFYFGFLELTSMFFFLQIITEKSGISKIFSRKFILTLNKLHISNKQQYFFLY